MNKKAILWKTIYYIALVVGLFLLLSFLNKRYDLLCVAKNILDAFGGCRK